MAELVFDAHAYEEVQKDEICIHVVLATENRKKATANQGFEKLRAKAAEAIRRHGFEDECETIWAHTAEVYARYQSGKNKDKTYLRGFKSEERLRIESSKLAPAKLLLKELAAAEGVEVSVSTALSREKTRETRNRLQGEAMKNAVALANVWAEQAGMGSVELVRAVDSNCSFQRLIPAQVEFSSSGSSVSGCSSGCSSSAAVGHSTSTTHKNPVFSGKAEVSVSVSCVFKASRK